MSQSVRNLEPKALWNYFADLNAVPRPSKKEERVIAFAKAFGESLNLPTVVDEVGNVIIKKSASKGMEGSTTVVLQSHLDMVHQKNEDTDFDFDTQGIQMYVDGDWVKAKGTTLGADNGIGVAAIMTLLASDDIPHPPLEALFTIDEETGMTGAKGLKGGYLDGKILLNLDTEDDDELTIGCAGGINVSAEGTYSVVDTNDIDEKGKTYQIALKGLTGGHSGMDIHKGLGNANKLMNRLLFELNNTIDVRIHSIKGGGLRNAIPRESFVILWVNDSDISVFISMMNEFAVTFQKEYQSTDPYLELKWEIADDVTSFLKGDFQNQFLRSIYACPNGIYRMSPDIKDLVQTSNNLAKVEVKGGKYSMLCLTRSSVDSEKLDEVSAIRSAFELLGASVSTDGDYPGWTPNPSAKIVDLMDNLYTELFDGKAHVNACHAGLECGILGTNYPDMEMISFGPNIRGAHSPDEKVQISSVQKTWKLLLETLRRV